MSKSFSKLLKVVCSFIHIMWHNWTNGHFKATLWQIHRHHCSATKFKGFPTQSTDLLFFSLDGDSILFYLSKSQNFFYFLKNGAVDKLLLALIWSCNFITRVTFHLNPNPVDCQEVFHLSKMEKKSPKSRLNCILDSLWCRRQP